MPCFCLQKHVFRRWLKKNDGDTVSIYGDRFIRCVEVSFVTGPRPIFRLCDETATDGILVDVSNFLMHISVAAQVAVMSAAALPETVGNFTVGLAVLHPRKKRRTVSPNPDQHLAGER